MNCYILMITTMHAHDKNQGPLSSSEYVTLPHIFRPEFQTLGVIFLVYLSLWEGNSQVNQICYFYPDFPESTQTFEQLT